MNPRRFIISVTVGIAVVLLLIGGTGTTTIIQKRERFQVRKKLGLTEHNTLLLPTER
jgi:hypothetical protein